MKRSYMAPMIVVENFVATSTIPNCMTKINFRDNGCVMNDPDVPDEMKSLAEFAGWFIDKQNGCAEVAEGMEFSDNICYHTNARATFTS